MDRHTHSAFERLEIVETGRRRRWSAAEKRRIVLESLSGPRVIAATARQHNISRSLLLIWRRAFLAENAGIATGFVPAVVRPEGSVPSQAAAANSAFGQQPHLVPQAALSSPPQRLELVLGGGRRIIAEGSVDVEAMLKLARGLERLA